MLLLYLIIQTASYGPYSFRIAICLLIVIIIQAIIYSSNQSLHPLQSITHAFTSLSQSIRSLPYSHIHSLFLFNVFYSLLLLLLSGHQSCSSPFPLYFRTSSSHSKPSFVFFSHFSVPCLPFVRNSPIHSSLPFLILSLPFCLNLIYLSPLSPSLLSSCPSILPLFLSFVFFLTVFFFSSPFLYTTSPILPIFPPSRIPHSSLSQSLSRIPSFISSSKISRTNDETRWLINRGLNRKVVTR